MFYFAEYIYGFKAGAHSLVVDKFVWYFVEDKEGTNALMYAAVGGDEGTLRDVLEKIREVEEQDDQKVQVEVIPTSQNN